MKAKICRWCNQRFVTYHNSQVFCSRACSELFSERENAEPVPDQDAEKFTATAEVPGSRQKIEILRSRYEQKQPLWHPHDRTDYRGVR